MKPLVVLIGPPGAGKTTVGQLLAQQLATGFRDTDNDVEAVTGRSISDIFIDDGEAAFRILEAQAVSQALTEHSGVLALGGGAPMNPITQAGLRDQRVCFLDLDVSEVASRVGWDEARPLLAVNPRAQWRKLMEQRRPVYAQLADLTINTTGQDPPQVASHLAGWLRQVGAA